MDGEINKLSLYCTDNHITVEDVTTVVSDLFSREVKIFDAIDSIFLGKNTEFLKVIQKLQNEGMMTAQVVTMFARQLRLLLLAKHLQKKEVKTGALGKLSSYTNNRWVARKILDQSRKYPEDVLLNIHTAFIGVDYLFKSESINQDSLGKIMIEAALILLNFVLITHRSFMYLNASAYFMAWGVPTSLARCFRRVSSLSKLSASVPTWEACCLRADTLISIVSVMSIQTLALPSRVERYTSSTL